MLCERRATHHARRRTGGKEARGKRHKSLSSKARPLTRERVRNHEGTTDLSADLDDAAGYVLALALTWCYAILWSWSIYPFVFFILAKTESRWMGFVAVLGAYGAWGFVNAIGCVVAMEAVRSGAWTPVFVWLGACIAWNACLFRSRPVVRRAKVA